MSGVVNANQLPLGQGTSIYLRPFTLHSWLGITASTVLLSAGAYAYIRLSKYHKNVSERWNNFCLWLFFTLVHSFYSSALTMYFSSHRNLPFNTIAEGVSLYPGWKMIMLRDQQIQIFNQIDKGNQGKNFKFHKLLTKEKLTMSTSFNINCNIL